MGSMKLELRKMILSEMRKRELGETKNPTWNNSNMRLMDIIKEEMTMQPEPEPQMNIAPEPEFSVWNPNEPEPMDYDWGVDTPTIQAGVPVSEDDLDNLTDQMAGILNTPIMESGGRMFSPALGNILGRVASTIESIRSNSHDAGRGSMGMDDVAVLRDIAMGPDADVLKDEAPEMLRTIEQMLQGVA